MKQYHLHYLATPQGAAEFLREADKFENRLGVEIVEALRRDIQDREEPWCDSEHSNTVDSILRENGVFDLYESCKALLEQVTGPAMVYGDGRGNDGTKTGLSHSEFNELLARRIAEARAAIARAERGQA